MKKSAIVVAAVAALLGSAVLSMAAGVPGATVKIVNPADATEFGTTLTDAEGAFAFEALPEGAWRLDVATADLAGQAQLLFAVPAEAAPARLSGRVTTLEGADVSLQVNAAVGTADEPGIALDEGYPRLQPAWNFNWRRANGNLFVRLAGTGLEGLEKVVLTSAAGTIESTTIFFDAESGEYRALFAKKAAFAALVPADAVRGATVALTVGLTTPVATGSFDASVRLVGPRRPPMP
jgi:hypothetical protein